MEIIEFYEQNASDREKYIQQIDSTDWDAAGYLAWMLRTNSFRSTCGEGSRVLMLVDGEKLASFCTLADFDEVKSDEMKPWMGFVYTFPEYRGHRCSGRLADYAAELAKQEGFEYLYVSSEETGLYEKYGFEFVEWTTSVHGYETKVFKRML